MACQSSESPQFFSEPYGLAYKHECKYNYENRYERQCIHDSFHFSFFASCLNCQPRRIGKKNRIRQPIANRPTAHSKFLISHSRVNHSMVIILKEPGNQCDVDDQ